MSHVQFRNSVPLRLAEINNRANKIISVAFIPQANYTAWATVTGGWILMQTFAERGMSRGQHGRKPTAVNLNCLDQSRYFSFKYLLIYPHEVEWHPFQTRCYSENTVAPGIEIGTSGSTDRTFEHKTTEAVKIAGGKELYRCLVCWY
jgi:hypothetical protein